jgi:hypothetical protein
MSRSVSLLFSFSLVLFCRTASAQNTARLRELFFASNSESAVAVFAKVSSQQNLSVPIHLAYMGVSSAMQAEYASAPWNKLAHFNDGKKAIERAVAIDPANPEIRFLRFSVQSNIPALLMYSENMDEDLSLIHAHISKSPGIERSFWNKALNVMLVAENSSTAQRQKIRALLSLLS